MTHTIELCIVSYRFLVYLKHISFLAVLIVSGESFVVIGRPQK